MRGQNQITRNGCLQACVATLLGAPVEKVPNFVDAPEVEGSEYPGWWLSLQGFLSGKGLWFLELHLTDRQPWFPLPEPALCIFIGRTNKGDRHMIIGRLESDQLIPVFNPLPEMEFETVEGLGFIVPRDPQMVIYFGKALDKISRLSDASGSGAGLMIVSEIHSIASEALGHSILNGKLIV